MYRTAYQSGMLTIFFSCGTKPLEIWDVVIKDGYIRQFLDQELKSMVLDIRGNNVSTTYMVCPSDHRILGISMPFLIMVVKNLKKYFSFEVTILDDTGTRRRFRVSNFQSTTQIMPLCTAMPIGLTDGWNQIQFNLAEFTRRAYNKQFVEVQNVKINANIRVRRIYFTQKLVADEELPPAYKLYFPLSNKKETPKKYKEDKENKQPADKHKGDKDKIMSAGKIEPVDSKHSELKEIQIESTNEIKTSRQSLHSIRGSKAQLPTSEMKEMKTNSRHSFQSIRSSKAQLASVTDPVEFDAGAEDAAAPGKSNAAFEDGGENNLASAMIVTPSINETRADMVQGPSTQFVEEPQVNTEEEGKSAEPENQPINEAEVEGPIADTLYDLEDIPEDEPAPLTSTEQTEQ